MASTAHEQERTLGEEYGVDQHQGSFTFEKAVCKIAAEKAKCYWLNAGECFHFNKVKGAVCFRSLPVVSPKGTGKLTRVIDIVFLKEDVDWDAWTKIFKRNDYEDLPDILKPDPPCSEPYTMTIAIVPEEGAGDDKFVLLKWVEFNCKVAPGVAQSFCGSRSMHIIDSLTGLRL